MVHFVESFAKVHKTWTNSRLSSNVVINNISYAIDSMTTAELLFKAKLKIRCVQIR